MKKLIVLVFVALFFCSCATGYHSKTGSGGYSQTQLDQNVFKVSFSGNTMSDMERVVDFALLRAAELTIENGFEYFAVIGGNNDATNVGLTVGNAYGYNNSVFGLAQTINAKKRTISRTIICFNQRPTSIFVYDASFVYGSITKKYNIQTREKG